MRALSRGISVLGLLALAAAIVSMVEATPEGRLWHWSRLLAGLSAAAICFAVAAWIARRRK